MTEIKFTAFRGFSRTMNAHSLQDVAMKMKSESCKQLVLKVRQLLAAGEMERAANTKRQLPGYTASATYEGGRTAPYITGYNDLIIIDIDHLSCDELPVLKTRLCLDPHTLLCFITPGGAGLKVIAYFRSEAMKRLRKKYFSSQLISYEQLEKYHAAYYDFTCRHYTTTYKVKVDISGKDIGRMFFLSYDPLVYLNVGLLNEWVPITTHILPPQADKKSVCTPPLESLPLPADGNVVIKSGLDTSCADIPLTILVEFKECERLTSREHKFEEGSHNVYIYRLGAKCYAHHIPVEMTYRLVLKKYDWPESKIRATLENAYTYTGQMDTQAQERKKPLVFRLTDFLNEHYEFHYNTILLRSEMRELSDTSAGDTEELFMPIDKFVYNSIYYELHKAGVTCSHNFMRSIIDSKFSTPHNPFENYFFHLPPWDGTTDYITELADTLIVQDQPFFREALKHWLVGMVAGALNNDVCNHIALVLTGGQGTGKSRWIKKLLPPQLMRYYRNGMLNPNNKDHMLMLTTCLLINLEEFEGVKYDEISELKRIITQDYVTERKVYDTDTDLYVRHASFIASTNEPRFLQDLSGSRRFVCANVESVDNECTVNHTGIFSQAYSLFRSGYRYWFELEEIDELNIRNELHRRKRPEEELLFLHFRRALPTDLDVKYMSASAILSVIALHNRISITPQGVSILSRVLDREGFTNHVEDGLVCYEVVQRTPEEVSRVVSLPLSQSKQFPVKQ